MLSCGLSMKWFNVLYYTAQKFSKHSSTAHFVLCNKIYQQNVLYDFSSINCLTNSYYGMQRNYIHESSAVCAIHVPLLAGGVGA